jgi:hypothetical protein
MIGMEPLRKGKTWSDDEVLQLLQNVRKKKSHEEIASDHQRTTGGIISKLKELAADYHYNDGRPIEEIQRYTGLNKEVIQEAIIKRRVTMEYKKQRACNRIEKKINATTVAAEPSLADVMKELAYIKRLLHGVLAAKAISSPA